MECAELPAVLFWRWRCAPHNRGRRHSTARRPARSARNVHPQWRGRIGGEAAGESDRSRRKESVVGLQSRRRPGSVSQDLRRGRQRAAWHRKDGSSAGPASSIRPIAILPWKPEEDAKRREFLLHMNPAADLRHVELNARCALPGLFQGDDNNNPYQFLQAPGRSGACSTITTTPAA